MRKYCVILIVLLLMSPLLVSCSREQEGVKPPPAPSEGTPTSLKLEIQPFEATRESTFYIVSKELDVSKANIQWFVNGNVVEGASGAQFRPSDIKKNDSIQVKVVLNDQEMESNLIKVKNIPPTVAKAKILPLVPKAHDTLKVDASGNDRDGDSVGFKYEWFLNGKSAGSGESLSGPFKRGDRIMLTITPFDGDDYGQPITLATDIFNAPPTQVTGSMEKIENNVYSYRIKAVDPDGDILTYSFKQAPAGMVIDNTGVITWRVTEKDVGRHPVSVKISDGRGGEVMYNFEVALRPE